MVEGIEDSAWRNNLALAQKELWKCDLFTDLMIVTKNGSVKAHKAVVAAASPYFKALLTSNLSEGQTNCLKLEEVTKESLMIVLNYIYSGVARLTSENAAEILVLSDYFQIHALKNLCCYYLKAYLDSSTCLMVHELAVLHNCNDLAESALRYAVSCFSDVIEDPSFTAVKTETLVTLLKQPYLGVSSEEKILMGILRWIASEPEERHSALTLLASHVDVASLTPEVRSDCLRSLQEEFLLTKEMQNFLSTVEKVAFNPDIRRQTEENQRMVSSSRHRREVEIIIVIGGESSGRLMGNLECFAVGFSSWKCSFPDYGANSRDHNRQPTQQVLSRMKYCRAYAACVTRQNIVYLLGGQNNIEFLHSCETYDVRSNSWCSLPDLPYPVHGAAASVLNGDLYLVGGKSSSQYEDRVWVYDDRRFMWMSKGEMLQGRGHFGAGSLHGCLYAVGGIGSSLRSRSEILSSCEKYDPTTNRWTPIASLSVARAYHGVVVLDNYLYAVGGYSETCWLSSVERYCPLKDQWTKVSPMMSCRSSLGITVSRGRIYCMGGFDGQSLLNTVEKYNPKTDMWHCVPPMQLRRYGLVAAAVNIPGKHLNSNEEDDLGSLL